MHPRRHPLAGLRHLRAAVPGWVLRAAVRRRHRRRTPTLPPEAALAAALAAPAGEPDGRTWTLPALAAHTGVSLVLLRALERQGLLVPRRPPGGAAVYTEADAEAVLAGRALLDSGVPLSELLDLARRHDAAMRETAARAVELFARYVSDPLAGAGASDGARAAELVAAFERMLPATATLVGHHFRRLVIESAAARLEPTSAPPAG